MRRPIWSAKGIFVDLKQQVHAWEIVTTRAGTPKSVYAQHPTRLPIPVGWRGNDGLFKCK